MIVCEGCLRAAFCITDQRKYKERMRGENNERIYGIDSFGL